MPIDHDLRELISMYFLMTSIHLEIVVRLIVCLSIHSSNLFDLEIHLANSFQFLEIHLQ